MHAGHARKITNYMKLVMYNVPSSLAIYNIYAFRRFCMHAHTYVHIDNNSCILNLTRIMRKHWFTKAGAIQFENWEFERLLRPALVWEALPNTQWRHKTPLSCACRESLIRPHAPLIFHSKEGFDHLIIRAAIISVIFFWDPQLDNLIDVDKTKFFCWYGLGFDLGFTHSMTVRNWSEEDKESERLCIFFVCWLARLWRRRLAVICPIGGH